MAGELIDIASQVGGGGAVGVILTYLGFRLKTKSELERHYMDQLAHNGQRIKDLEKRVDERDEQLKQEREHCDKRIAELDRKWSEKFDAITQPMYFEPDSG